MAPSPQSQQSQTPSHKPPCSLLAPVFSVTAAFSWGRFHVGQEAAASIYWSPVATGGAAASGYRSAKFLRFGLIFGQVESKEDMHLID